MRILVVDDEPLIRRALGKAMLKRGHDVLEASDGSQGLKMWETHAPDILVLDVLMPEMTGPQMVQKGQRMGLKVKHLVFMSAFTGSEQKSLQELGAVLFLPKPFPDLFEVVSKIENLVL